jgi:hypothetical protein
MNFSHDRAQMKTFLIVIILTLAHAGPPSHAAGPQLPPLTTAEGNPRLPGKFIWA